MKHRAWLWMGALLLLSCSDPLKEVQLVSEPRVLGARVEVSGEPERASPAPGEDAAVRWLVAAPWPDPALGYRLAVCAAAPDGATLPACAEAPFAETSVVDPVPGEPRLAFTVPVDVAATSLAVLGVVCPDGAPADDGGCSDGSGTQVSFDFALGPEQVNYNPSIEPDALSFDGGPWAAGSDCAALPSVAPGSEHALELLLDEGDRDPLEAPTSVDPLREPLQASHFATGGELQRAFTLIPDDQDDLAVRLSWKAPGGVPDDGLARFFFVVRDSRGGTDWLERAVCVAP